jgi:hypothetical protein
MLPFKSQNSFTRFVSPVAPDYSINSSLGQVALFVVMLQINHTSSESQNSRAKVLEGVLEGKRTRNKLYRN